MTVPILPSKGSTDWYDYITGLDSAVRSGTGGGSGSLGVINVKDYGAVGDGTTDDTTAINAAVTAQLAGIRAGTPVYFPAGVYVYTGPGFDVATPWFVGAGRSSTYIDLTGTDYFIDANQAFSMLWVSGLLFYSGTGAIRNRYTGSNVNGHMVVRDCAFDSYTGAAITTNANDGPYWKIHGNTFKALDSSSTSMGVALSGLLDSVSIVDNSFVRNQVHVKLAQGGNNAYLRNNDFLQFSNTGTGRTALWIVPNATGTNSGAGLVVNSNKFGNESYESTDYKILVADEGTGATFGERLPTVAADSTGYVTGGAFSENHYQFSGSGGPLIYSTTPNLGGLKVDGFTAGGMTEVIKFRTTPTGIVPDLLTNQIGPIRVGDENGAPPPISLAGGVGRVVDPAGVFESDTYAPHSQPGGSALTAFARLDTAKVNSWTVTGTTTKAAATDALGGTDAITVTGPSGGAEIYNSLDSTKLRAHAPMWVELDVRAVSGSAATTLSVIVKTTSNTSQTMRRTFTLPSVAAGWQRIRYLVYPRSTASTMAVVVWSYAAGDFRIGRARIYHAREPQMFEHVLTSPNGTRYLLNVSDAGVLSTSVVT